MVRPFWVFICDTQKLFSIAFQTVHFFLWGRAKMWGAIGRYP
jgi:hypothetical protein